MKKTGRNDPCPCGSGKKYKKCCMNAAQLANEELQDAIQGHNFQTLDEAQSFANAFMQQRNQTALVEFSGLSPEQMHKILNFPFASPEIIYFSETSHPDENQSPLFVLFNLIVNAIGDDGLKATAKGNLPQKFCRESALAYWGDELHAEKTRFGKINKEEDFFELHVARIIAEMSGYLVKRKNRFHLTRKYNDQYKKNLDSIFPVLFKTYIKEFNWGYWDGFKEVPFIQQAAIFSLYLLNQYGDETRTQDFYEDKFLTAFPDVVDKFNDTVYSTPEDECRYCYTLRTLRRFLQFSGIAKIQEEKTDQPFGKHFKIKKTSLFHKLVIFTFSDQYKNIPTH